MSALLAGQEQSALSAVMINFIVFMINFVLCVGVGWWASTVRRNALAWFVVAWLTTPVIGFLILLYCGDVYELRSKPNPQPAPQPTQI